MSLSRTKEDAMSRGLPYLSVVAVACLIVTSGCGGKQVTTSVQDQSTTKKPNSARAASPAADTAKAASIPSPGTDFPPLARASEQESIDGARLDTRVTDSPVMLAQPSQSSTSPVATLPSLSSEDLRDLYFDFDRAAIRGDAKATLDEDARVLATHHPKAIVVEGHCDERGTSAYNLVLGERRARSVKSYLEALGVKYDVKVVSFGKEKPICSEQNEACWQKNRRAHLAEQK
jgi:peptidoglycan-associated lipoprotein